MAAVLLLEEKGECSWDSKAIQRHNGWMISGSGFLVKVVQAVLYGTVSSLRKGCLMLWGGHGGAMGWSLQLCHQSPMVALGWAPWQYRSLL